MRKWLTVVGLLGLFLFADELPLATAAKQGRPFTLAATKACLMARPDAVAGLPPANPPAPPLLFVYRLAHEDYSTGIGLGPRPRAHVQLGAWSGDRRYQGIILSFFKTVPDARASLKTLAWSYGGQLIRNVVATWDQTVPSLTIRRAVLGCLRSERGGLPAAKPPPPATVATFAGYWGGHTRGLSITSSGRVREYADSGCCSRYYDMTLQILSVSGTITHATAAYRVTSFKHLQLRGIRVGERGTLRLNNGIVTSSLTRDDFCSDPTWGVTGACGA